MSARNGTALDARVLRIREHRQLAARELVPDACSAAGAAEDGPAIVGVPRTGGPVGIDHQVRDRARRQDRVVAPGPELDGAIGPAQPPLDLGVEGRHVDVGEVPRRGTGPGGPGAPVRLPGELDLARRLHMAQPQSGRGRQIGRAQLVLREAEELPTVGPCRTQRLTEGGGEGGEDVGRGLRRRVVPVGCHGDSTEQWLGVLGRAGVTGGLLGPAYDVQDLRLVDVAARHDAGSGALRGADGGHDGQRTAAHQPIGRERVARPAQVGLAALVEAHDAGVRGRGRECPVDDVLRGQRAGAGHRPAS